jgi:hypothetical protein
MTKRRRASELMFKTSHGFGPRGRLPIVAVTSGTGTIAVHGIITILATTSNPTAQTAWLTISSGTNIGTIVGTGIGA